MIRKRLGALIIAFCFSCTCMMAAQHYQFTEGHTSGLWGEEIEAKTDSLDEKDDTPYVKYKDKSAVGLNIGVATGFGVEYARNFHRRFNAKVRFSYLSYEYKGIKIEEEDRELEGEARLKTSNLDVIAQWLPFKKSSFHMDFGLAYFFKLASDGVGRYQGEVTYGDIVLTGDDIGELTYEIEWDNLAPFMGLGFGRAVPKNRFGFGFDLGVYYVGSPDVTIVGTNLLSGNSEEEPVLEDNLKDYNWWPFVNFKFSYKL